VASDLPDLQIVVAGEHARSSSTIATSGAYVVIVSTTVPALAVTLTSVYLGVIDGDTSASHLRLAPRRAALLTHRVLTGLQPGATHARACMLDHSAELRDALAQLTHADVRVDIAPDVLEHASAAWTATGRDTPQ
jgi:hypothetical protein